MSQLGQAPERGQSGSFLNKGSVYGPRVNFVSQSSTGTASFTIAANSPWTVQSVLRAFDPSLTDAQQTDDMVIDPSKIQNWDAADIYIDNDNDSNYYIGWGASLSSGQTKVTMGSFDQITPEDTSTGNPYSAETTYLFYNNDGSSHVVYIHLTGRFIQVAF